MGVNSAPGTTALSSVHVCPGSIILDSRKLAPGTTNLSEVAKSVPGLTGVDLTVGTDLLVVGLVSLLLSLLLPPEKCIASTITIIATMMTIMSVSKWWVD